MQFAETLDALTGAMREEAERCYPNEACGFIIQSSQKKARFMPCNNVAPAGDQFVIHHNDWMRAEDSGEILAIWHSHPNASSEPSEIDMAGCNMTELPWLISSLRVEEGKFVHEPARLVEPNGTKVDYIGRPYVFGTFDCYSLMVDFYEREFGIRLDKFAHLRIPEWWKKGLDILAENFESQGLVRVTDGTFQYGDVLLVAMDSDVSNHIAVYVTGDIILHHLVNRLSRRETFGPHWLSMVKLHLRHKSKC